MIRQKGPLPDSDRAPRPLRQAECRPTSACSPQSRQSTTPIRRSWSAPLGREGHFSPNAAPSGCAEDRVGRGHERTTHQSCDESLRRLGLRCPMMRRHYDARRRFELTGQVTPIHSPALVELVGRVPGAPPEQPTGSQPTTPCRGLGAACPPVAPRMVPRCHGWRSPSIGHDTAPAAGRPRRHGSVRPGGIGTQPALTTSAP